MIQVHLSSSPKLCADELSPLPVRRERARVRALCRQTRNHCSALSQPLPVYRERSSARYAVTETAVKELFSVGRRHGFTLVEILIVVVILGILAAVVVPQFSNASGMARENALKDDLRYLRMQIGVYKAQHQDAPPGYANGNTSNAPDALTFVLQLTQYTNHSGEYSATPDADHAFGPYMLRVPVNPLNGKDGVWVYAADTQMPAPNASIDAGWIYNATTQQIIPNLPGVDASGVAYADY
jgi:general secretion pathway protein G